MDKIWKQPNWETPVLLPVRSGQPDGYDFEYAHNGTANLLMLFDPLEGQHISKDTGRRTGI